MPPTRAQEIQGWMDDNELAWLSEQASQMGSVAEIGCWRGRSTFALLSSCKGPVYAVDHFLGSPNERNDAHRDVKSRDIHAEFMANVGHFPNLKLLRLESAEAAEIAPSVDMVFIDGTHTAAAVTQDIRLWWPKARKILCGHDYTMGEVGVSVKSLLEPKFGPGSIWYFQIP